MLKPKNLYEVLELNVVSGIEVVRVLSKPGNLNSEGASLILISSIVGFLGQAGKVGYSASKGAVLAASKSLSLELAARNIRVNSILPGMVRTEMSEKLMDSIGEEARNKIVKMHPLGIGTPEDVASACAFILSDAAKWITGTSFIVDGGYSAA
jgi:NAD(P)-dependent dehydrogenase (short-subunit alcohol dehydrogenase family)